MTLTPPKCKTCGKAEWRHICAGRDDRPFTTPALEAAQKRIDQHIAGSSNGRTAAFDAANVGSNPAPATKLKRARKALKAAETKAAPLKPKKRKPRMAKAGRKPVKTDERSIKARERMAAKRAAEKAPPKPKSEAKP